MCLKGESTETAPLSFWKISNSWFSTAIKNFSPALVSALASSKEKGRRASFSDETAEVMTEMNLVLYTALCQKFVFGTACFK